ncbi:hypothetical protein Y032_0010g1012 [Ancylostoma ceylanicum]|uniref:Uncharacterized protein n=1 Tax=Ancylostoma ceylanicum TaxID=53326 RepID=A0A016VGP8_9BILA|nr:hypothetical protein Y032_0010g1012 [Ancylostoma ceylanicum]
MRNRSDDSKSEQSQSTKETSSKTESCCLHGVPCVKADPLQATRNLSDRRCISPFTECLLPNSQESVALRLPKNQEKLTKAIVEQPPRSELGQPVFTTTSDPLLHYIGIMTPAEAEEAVPRPTSFRLYHQTKLSLSEMREALRTGSPDAISPVLPLCVIYRCSEGQIRYERQPTNSMRAVLIGQSDKLIAGITRSSNSNQIRNASTQWTCQILFNLVFSRLVGWYASTAISPSQTATMKEANYRWTCFLADEKHNRNFDQYNAINTLLHSNQ